MKKIRRRVKRTARLRGILALLLVLPALTGGCPEFRNSVIDSVDAATRALIFDTTTTEVALENAVRGIINATLDLAFDQLRVDTTR